MLTLIYINTLGVLVLMGTVILYEQSSRGNVVATVYSVDNCLSHVADILTLNNYVG